MPELPEVETTRRGIAPHIQGKRVERVVVRQPKLRWPIPPGLDRSLKGARITGVERRAKYLLIRTDRGTLIMHLGMSGSLRILPTGTPAGVHDHFDLAFGDCCLRLRDPRRFGAVLWSKGPVEQHELIRHLGPEPLSDRFTAEYLHGRASGRKTPVKNLIMDAGVVVGVGNIYANEALFLSGIHPGRAAGRISLARYRVLTGQIREVLAAAIEKGGTTLRDFLDEEGRPGYFAQELQVYGKAGVPCPRCRAPIRQLRISQRSCFYCSRCQH